MCELFTDAIVADNRTRREVIRKELQAVGLSMTDIKHAQPIETIESSRLQRSVVVHLQLEDVRPMAKLIKDVQSAVDPSGTQ